MKKDKICFLFSFICFILLLALTFALIGSLNKYTLGNGESEADNTEGEPDFSGIGVAIGLALVFVLLVLYAAASAIPILIKVIQLFVCKKGLGIASLCFDILFAAFGIYLLADSVIGGLSGSVMLNIWTFAAALLPIGAAACDFIGIRKIEV